MKAKTSKVKSEMVIGFYSDVPLKKAKKIEKKLIQRTRRIIEKREAFDEVNEALTEFYSAGLAHIGRATDL